jgi:hypothetical protein
MKIREETTNKNLTKDISAITSNQGPNTFKIKRKFALSTANGGSKATGGPLLGPPAFADHMK